MTEADKKSILQIVDGLPAPSVLRVVVFCFVFVRGRRNPDDILKIIQIFNSLPKLMDLKVFLKRPC